MPNVSVTATRQGMRPEQRLRFEEVVSGLYLAEDDNVWHDGDCIGGDDEAHQFVATLSHRRVLQGLPRIHMIGHPGDTPQFYASNVFDESREIKGNIARNHDMVDECEVLIACPGEFKEILRSGTWSTIRYAKRRIEKGVKLIMIIIWPDGSIEKVPPA